MPYLVGGRGLEVEALPARQKDLPVERERCDEQDETDRPAACGLLREDEDGGLPDRNVSAVARGGKQNTARWPTMRQTEHRASVDGDM